MYTDPLSIYREYVQNSADAIQEARRIGSLTPSDPGRVDITIDYDDRCVVLRDNGAGIPVADAARRLLAIGGSSKRGTKARGFRGIGRLAGLAYCRELIFRTRAAGDDEVVELRWDCVRLRAALRAIGESDDLPGVVDKIVTVERRPAAAEDPAHFFEVEIRDVVRHHRRDALLNEELIAAYLSEVAPVPFDARFTFGAAIEEHLSRYVELPRLEVRINGCEPLVRPHRVVFSAKANQNGHLSDCELLTFEDRDGGVAAVGWLLHHQYLGAIPAHARMGGLRLRAGDIQVGGHQVLEDHFPEPRFNGWTVAEVHVVDRRIVPNARRDNFEQNVHFNDLTAQLEPLARQIAKRCRSASIDRNRAKALQVAAHNLRAEIDARSAEIVPGDVRPYLERCLGAMRAFVGRREDVDGAVDPVHAALAALEEALSGK
jgi:molecular chaperone HtpG